MKTSPEVEQTLAGWMGRYSRRDEAIRDLLTRQEGWDRLREMALFEAIQRFSGSEDSSDRLGAARSCMAFVDLFAALDELFLEVEEEYLGQRGVDATPSEMVRRGLVRLRRGDVDGTAAEFDRAAPQGAEFLWGLGKAGLEAVKGRAAEAKALLAASGLPPDEEASALAQVCCYVWECPCPEGHSGSYRGALDAFRRGDWVGGVMALQLLDFGSNGTEAHAELFLYSLFQHAFANLALEATGAAGDPGEAFLAARAREFLGDYATAIPLYERVREGKGKKNPAGWIFSPYHGPEEVVRLAEVYRGAALYRTGYEVDGVAVWRRVMETPPGPLVTAALAELQADLGSAEPLGSPRETAAASLRSVWEVPPQLPDDEDNDLLPSLYPARIAEVTRRAVRVHWQGGADRQAVEEMERAHKKSGAYRPDFVNPPAFLADLARAYVRAGEYATGVAILFELAREYPSARLAYESLKRLYASKAGGEVPPR